MNTLDIKPFTIPGTTQEIFDKVAAHLLTQKTRASGEFTCMYRGKNNTKCAVGCLIPDEFYDRNLENLPARLLVQKEVMKLATPSAQDILYKLQVIHDIDAPTDWEHELRKVGERYALDTSVLDKEY
jgi:hypothetical protein